MEQGLAGQLECDSDPAGFAPVGNFSPVEPYLVPSLLRGGGGLLPEGRSRQAHVMESRGWDGQRRVIALPAPSRLKLEGIVGTSDGMRDS